MPKYNKIGFAIIGVVVLSIFINTKIAFGDFFSVGATYNFSAIAALKQFGGKIISAPKAYEIKTLEAIGYQCLDIGSSFTMVPVGLRVPVPLSYYIPPSVTSRTGIAPATGQWIIGKYGTKTPINCMLKAYPYTVKTVYLDTVVVFGNSGL